MHGAAPIERKQPFIAQKIPTVAILSENEAKMFAIEDPKRPIGIKSLALLLSLTIDHTPLPMPYTMAWSVKIAPISVFEMLKKS